MTEALGSTATPESGRPDSESADAGSKKARRGGKRGKKGPLARLALFYRQIVAELRKVVWPTRNDLITYTSVVIVFVVVIIALVTVIDWGFNKGVSYVFG
ncbi:preprotein translocase subunit SecE [Actinacidiphila glaucinigra]|uniref:preprotein translocase subunit SecE n=1 Tax=Actinacidiphila glaucinigra TaxID=235986 RepID=UPI0033B45E26